MICDQIRTFSSGSFDFAFTIPCWGSNRPLNFTVTIPPLASHKPLDFAFTIPPLVSHRPLDFAITISPLNSHKPLDFAVTILCDNRTVLFSPLCPDSFLLQSHCRCANVLCRLTAYTLCYQALVAYSDLKAQPFKLPVLQSRPILSQPVQIGWMVLKPALSLCSLKSVSVYNTKRQNDMRVWIVIALLHRFEADRLPVRVKRTSVDCDVSTQTVLGKIF